MLQTVDRALRLLLLFEEVDQEHRVSGMLDVDESIASRRHAHQAGISGGGSGRRGVLNMGSSHNLVEQARRSVENLASPVSSMNWAVIGIE